MSTHNIPLINIINKTIQVIPNLQLWDFFKKSKNEFEIAVVNEPSVFEPLKVYCMHYTMLPINATKPLY